jgi:hypothetical protein
MDGANLLEDVPPGGSGMNPNLLPRHYQHFLDDGWTDSQITQAIGLGVRSVDQIEASRLLGYPAPSSGIWFPFSETFGQLRPDQPWYIDRKTGQKKETGKYIHRKGGAGPSALWMSSGITKPKQLAAVTEGWKDAARPYLDQGVPIGAIPGVSWVSKVLPKGCGVALVFDSDAWINAQVMSDLINGGLHNRGKVAIVPGEPTAKRGLTEFVNDSGDVAKLLEDAKAPKALFLEWLDFLVANPLQPIKNADTVADLHRWVLKIAKRLRMKQAIKPWFQRHWAAYKTALNAKLQAEQVLGYDDAPIGEYEPIEVSPRGQRRLIALNGQMGTGKTSIAILGAVVSALKQGQRVLWAVPTRFLSENSSRRLERALAKLGIYAPVACHLDKNLNPKAQVWITCGESLHQAPAGLWDVLIGDEVNEWVPRLLLGALGKNPLAARAAFLERLQGATTIILANDGIYRPVLDCVQRLANMPADRVEIISRRRQPQPMKIRLYQGQDGFYAFADAERKAYQAGHKVASPSGGQKNLRKRERWIGSDGLTCVDRPDTLPELRAEIAANPDAWIAQNQPQWFGWTGVFGSGISIECPYFTTQFEYVAAGETSSSALQRGSRVRAALGGGKIDTRHVFVQDKGMPTKPHTMPLETFGPDFWRMALSQPQGQIEALLSPLGLGDVGKAADAGHVAPIDEFPELADMMAIQARETHLKLECLKAEYALCGWTVEDAPALDEDAAKVIAAELREVYEAILLEEANIRATAPTKAEAAESHPDALERYESGGEPTTPYEGRLFDAWAVEERIGAIQQLSDPQFWASCHLEKPQAIDRAVLRMVVEMAIHHPQQFAEWRQWAALKTVAVGHITPPLPVSPRILERAALLAQCPGIAQVLDGTLTQWDKNTPLLIAAHRWAVANAERLAQTTAHSQRNNGLQFTPRTPIVKALHKLLGEMGIETQDCGEIRRVQQYRIKTVTDASEAIQEAMAMGNDARRLERDAYRLDQFPNIVDAARSVAMDRTLQWAAVTPEIIEALAPTENFSKEDSISTEVLRTPSEPTPTAPFRPGERVRKRGAVGWTGLFAGLDRAGYAIVRWFGDAVDSQIGLDSLESIA